MARVEPINPIPQMERETQEIVDSLAVPYQEIGAKSLKEKRYRRITNVAALFLLIGVFGLILFTTSLTKPSLGLYLDAVLILVSFSLSFVFGRKRTASELDPEQALFLTTYEMATELRQYPLPFDTKTEASNLQYVIDELELIWKAESRLAKEVLSNVTELMNNLRFRLLQAFAKGKTEDVKLAVWTLAKLCPLLIGDHPTLSEIEDINYRVSKLPESKEAEQVKIRVKMRSWLATHSMVKWIGIACGCVIAGAIIVIVGDYLGHPAEGFDAGVLGAIALFVGFLTSPRLKKA